MFTEIYDMDGEPHICTFLYNTLSNYCNDFGAKKKLFSYIKYRKKWRDLLIKFIKIPRKCNNCHQYYNIKNSLGKYQCYYHPGQFSGDGFTCCGGFIASDGCTKCDHFDGVREFKTYHTRDFNEDESYFECCGGKYNSGGCTIVKHIDGKGENLDSSTSGHKMKIPLFLFIINQLKLPPLKNVLALEFTKDINRRVDITKSFVIFRTYNLKN